MTSGDHLIRVRERGARVREFLNSDLVREAVEAIDAEYIKALMGTKPEQNTERETLYMEHYALRRVLARLRSWEQDGLVAEAEEAE